MKSLALTAALLLITALAARADGLEVRSLSLQGQGVGTLPDVAIRLPGQPKAAAKALSTGQTLAPGTELTLPRGGSAVLASKHDNQVTLYPGAAFVVGNVVPNGESHQLVGGKAEFSVKRALDFFNIGYDRFTAAVRGTVYSIEVLSDQDSVEFNVREGAVEVEQQLPLRVRPNQPARDADSDSGDPQSPQLRIVEDISAGQSRRYALNVGQYLSEFGNFGDADGYFRRALAQAERTGDAQRVQRAVANLMQVNNVLRRPQAVVELGTQCTETARAAGLLQAQRNCLSLLAEAHLQLGQRERALEYMQRVLDAERERTQGRDSMVLAAALNNAGRAYSTQGDHAKALALMTESVQMLERLQGGADSMTMATFLVNLALAYRGQGQVSQALAACERALEIARRVRPDGRHQVIALLLMRQGQDNARLGKLQRAAERLQEAAALYLTLFPGRDHPRAAESAADLAAVLLRLDRVPEAGRAAEDALSMYERLAAGQPQAGLVRALRTLGEVARRSGRPDEARAHAERADAMQRQLRQQRGG